MTGASETRSSGSMACVTRTTPRTLLVDTPHVLRVRIAGDDPVSGDPDVVDQDVEPHLLPFDPCGCCRDRSVISDVYRNEACAQLLGRTFTPLLVARPQVHGMPESDQTSRSWPSK